MYVNWKKNLPVYHMNTVNSFSKRHREFTCLKALFLSFFLTHYTYVYLYIYLFIYLFPYHLLNDAVSTLESVAWNYGMIS